jgi:uncharacterized RDD family membrane protein YckC
MEQGSQPAPPPPPPPPPPGPQAGSQPYPQWQAPPQPYGYGYPAYPYGGPPPTPPQPSTTPGERPRELPWRLSGWWSRVGAQLLDFLIVWVPGAIVLIVLAALAAGAHGGARTALLIATIVASFVVLAVHLFYAPLLMKREGRRNGQTWGKQIAGIRVIRADGEPMGFAQAALRQIIFKSFGVIVAATFVPLFPWILNYLWPTWDEERRALHDLAADTRVVKS